MRQQPHPDVTSNDVKRIVRRDFPSAEFDTVMEVLNRYGVERWERECVRVQLAALKLADRNPDRLRKAIDRAKRDYRDVLTPAEYPEYGRRTSSSLELAGKEHDRIIDSDWAQYEAWLKR